MKVAVIGGGVAGTAAAWAARRAGADVTVFFDRPGATSLYSGALDVLPWEDASPNAPLLPDVLAFAAAIEAWSVHTTSCRFATHEGVLRPARGGDAALLDLAPLAGRRVAVAETEVEGWTGAGLARSLSASAWAERTRTRFEAVAIAGFLDASDVRGPPFDVARLHDSAARVERLASCLTRADASADAWLLGPWLGTLPGVAQVLSEAVGRPCGETTSPPGGPAGARFEASRDTLFENLGVFVRQAHVAEVGVEPGGVRVSSGPRSEDGFDSAVLCLGGVVAGGIALTDDGTTSGLATSVRAELPLGMDGHILERTSGRGPDWFVRDPLAIERVGVLEGGAAAAVRGTSRLFVAGDAVADRPRTALEAARSGILAGTAAARPLIRQ